MFSFCWFHCQEDPILSRWLLYAGHTIVGVFPTKHQAYKKRRYLQSLLDNFKFDHLRMEINLLIEDMRDG